MDCTLFALLCMAATASCYGLDTELGANLKSCPSFSGPSILDVLDKDSSGVERLVVYFYREKNKSAIISVIPFQEYQDCFEDLPKHAFNSITYHEEDSSINLLFNLTSSKSIRHRPEPSTTTSITESPHDNWEESWYTNEIPAGGSTDFFDNDDSEPNYPVVISGDDNLSPIDTPTIYDSDNNESPKWQIPVEQPDSNEVPEWSQEYTPYSNDEFLDAPDQDVADSNNLPDELDYSPPNEYTVDNIPIEKPLEIPQDSVEFVAEVQPQLNPIIIESNEAPVFQPQENAYTDAYLDSENKQYDLSSGEDHDISPLDSVSPEDFTSKKINEGFIINNHHTDIPVGNNYNHNNEFVDSNDFYNSQENPYNNEPSKADVENTRNHINLVYKWQTVRVPRIDSNGYVYGWVWQRAKLPVRAKSQKWSFWESRGKKHHSVHWKHKSSKHKSSKHISSKHKSSKHYKGYDRGLDKDITVGNFDIWLKKQFQNMQSNGNKMPSGSDYLQTVRLAIEQTLKTNGIRMRSAGNLIDADGNVLRLDNVELRPIFIGRSLSYNRRIKKYKIPTQTPFLQGLLVSLINPAKTLGIVPLGITALPQIQSNEGNARKLNPVSVPSRLHELIPGIGKISPRIQPKILVKDENISSSEEAPGFRIIGGSVAIGTGTPLASRGRSGKD